MNTHAIKLFISRDKNVKHNLKGKQAQTDKQNKKVAAPSKINIDADSELSLCESLSKFRRREWEERLGCERETNRGVAFAPVPPKSISSQEQKSARSISECYKRRLLCFYQRERERGRVPGVQRRTPRCARGFDSAVSLAYARQMGCQTRDDRGMMRPTKYRLPFRRSYPAIWIGFLPFFLLFEKFNLQKNDLAKVVLQFKL